MADLFTSETFSEYSVHVEEIANGWKGLSVDKCAEILSKSEENKIKDLALYKCVKFARLLGLPGETNLVSYKFEDYLPGACSSPVVRQKEGQYVIQIDNIPVPLMENQARFDIRAEVQTIETVSKEKYQLASFVFTLPSEVKSTGGFATQVTFALKVDAVKNSEGKANNEDLVALFKMDVGAPVTISQVAEFREGAGYTLARDLQPGLYPFNRFEIIEDTKTENGKTNRWKSVLLYVIDGTVVKVALGSRLGSDFFGNQLALDFHNATISKNGFCTLYISQIEDLKRGDSFVKVVHGRIFNNEVPAPLRDKFSGLIPTTKTQPIKSIKSAEPLIDFAEIEIPRKEEVVQVAEVVQVPPVTAAKEEPIAAKTRKSTKEKELVIQAMPDSEAPDFDSF
jgi:hypothetical protein